MLKLRHKQRQTEPKSGQETAPPDAAHQSPIRRGCVTVNAGLVGLEGRIHRWLVGNSVAVLRICLGLVFLGFGLLKYFPGVSPAENLTVTTTHLLTFGFVGGVIPKTVGLAMVASLECAIGLSLITTLWLRLTMYLLTVELIGILSPLVLLPHRLFAGPHHAPTLEGQYVLKDIILVAAAMVVATGFRGARIRYAPPGKHKRFRPGRAIQVNP